MENIVKDIEQMAKSRNLPPASEIDIDIKIRSGKLDSVKVSFYVGEMPVDVEWCDNVGVYDQDGAPLDVMALITHELDGLYHVSDGLYERIAEAHLGGSAYKKIVNGVYVEAFYEGKDTYMVAISQKPYYDFADLQMCKYRNLRDDFSVDKYFEVRDRVKERRLIEDEREREHMAYLRRTTDRAVLCNV